MKLAIQPWKMGLLGFIGMLVLYQVLMWTITKDPLHAYYFFLDKWYLFIPMFIAFAVQMIYMQKVRLIIHTHSRAMTGTSAGASGVAMVACCAHHIADIIPILGFFGIAGSMTMYQDWFLAGGVLINVLGVWYMVHRYKTLSHMQCATNEKTL